MPIAGLFTDALIVGLGGFCGAIVRYLAYLGLRGISPSPIPLATLIVNVTGCFLLGALTAAAERQGLVSRHVLLVGASGFIASYTTYSTFALETLMLAKNDSFTYATLNVVAQLVLGIGAAWLGRWIAGT